MKLLSIEPTPSPHTMKLNIDETLPAGKKYTYLKENEMHAPEPIRSILRIDGVKSVFHTANFLAVDRYPKADWKSILQGISELLGGGMSSPAVPSVESSGGFGEAHVYVQFFRGIPLQVRVRSEGEEVRRAMPQRFNDAVMKVIESSPTLLKERKLVDKGVRYGDLTEIAEQMIQELDATYTDEELERLVKAAADYAEGSDQEVRLKLTRQEILEQFSHSDWRRRYAALEQLSPSEEDLPLLEKALRDEHASIRRLAVVYLGDISGKRVLPYLYQALRDPSVQVRRTAGDTLNDIGDTDAIGPMCEALKDANKLVRWRAARFLYEYGDESALEALREAENDEEFEVSLQVKMAIERITRGEEAAGSVWQQMTRSRQK